MIRSGRADVVIAGGTEAAIHPLPIAGFAAMQALSTRNDEPERASRPFDKGRDGFVLGEGAGIVILESADHARSRGIHLYGEVAGVGITSDAHHIAQPDPGGTGAARAMRLALEHAGAAPTTWSTSMRTPPRPRSGTSPRSSRSGLRSAPPPTMCW